MRSLKALGLVSAIASILLGAVASYSVPITYNSWPWFRVKNTFYFTGFNPGDERVLTLPNSVPRQIVRTSNICGFVKFSAAGITTFKKDGQTFTVSNFPSVVVPKCIVGNPATYLTQNVRDANYFYLANVPTQSPITITVDGDYVYRRVANACGYFTWNIPVELQATEQEGFMGTSANPMITDFAPSTFPQAPVAPKCLTIDGTQRLFVPVVPGFTP